MKDQMLELIRTQEGVTPKDIVNHFKNERGESEVLRELIKLLAARTVLMDDSGLVRDQPVQLANA